ncbi:NAD(P)/FAD-dependent oxidoreductase [Nocardia otitidiscaviarum]|uniref:NAD(P)/FAD-dependent oxidoreductase n=1 Tax=Nocardia otitidiscaviarum TaxID=1823 RepID=UPI00163DC1E5|nr:NAD(P)/FAD-dependent oxidoreductase [Nocardia otitidiscaviarum]MBF6180053.1 NAD(P)/FAD-dependent oxidoreductase [Nocardia otitidiscaviarum]MCP9625058.1 NAD(P)/FAD-dependent oxidoreductase [Nocardia otitidiscaviarum]
MNITHYDTVIVGGGPAGLTAAMALTRYRRRTLVVESPEPPRNAASHGIHGLIGLDGISPAQLRARTWAELDAYGLATRADTTADDITRDEGGFTVTLGDGGRARAATVLLATGMVDIHPDIDGLAACWGRTVIHCPFCVGEENADRTWAVMAGDPDFAAMIPTAFRAWTSDVVVIAPPELERADEIRSRLREQGSDLIQGEIARFAHRDGDLSAIEFTDGRALARQTLLWHLPQRQVPLITRLSETLGLTLDSDGLVTVDRSQRTSIDGLYAAGDLTTLYQGAMNSAGAGAAAADAIHFADF